jgi:hypothetical protein
MYKALIQPVEPIVNNKMISGMKIPLNTKVFLHSIFSKGVIPTKENLAYRN